MDRTNQLMELANGEKFAVLKQFNKEDATYYFVVGVNKEEDELTNEFTLFMEYTKDGKTFMKEIKDPEILSKFEINVDDFK